MSEEKPDIVLNEFGDLSRKARRELEAKGIDPDTAVIEYKIATSQIPIITEEQAAEAKAQSQSAGHQEKIEEVQQPVVHHSPSPTIPAGAMPPAASIIYNPPPMQSAVAPTAAGFPRVDNTVVSANTGPIEPISVEPALDSGSLAAVEQTLAAAADPEPSTKTGPTPISAPSVLQQTAETVTDSPVIAVTAAAVTTNAFDDLLATESSDFETDPVKEKKLTRKEKKALKHQAAEARVLQAPAEPTLAQESADQPGIIEEDKPAEIPAAPIAAAAVVMVEQEEILEAENPDHGVDEDSVVLEISEGLTVIYEDEADSPQTISEVTAAIAVAEAVAAAEAAVENGEVVMDISASEVPTTTGSIPIIPNALILPTLPENTGQITPITQTGELVITGSLLIPPSVSQVGANIDHFDTSEIDIIGDDEEVQNTATLAPVSAASAVSAYDIANSVITKPKGMNERLPYILSITAAGLAVGVVALLVVGYITGMF